MYKSLDKIYSSQHKCWFIKGNLIFAPHPKCDDKGFYGIINDIQDYSGTIIIEYNIVANEKGQSCNDETRSTYLENIKPGAVNIKYRQDEIRNEFSQLQNLLYEYCSYLEGDHDA